VRPEFEVLETRRLLSAIGSASPPVLDAYAHNPLSFEPNMGQTAAQVQFLARGQGYALYLTPDEAVLSLQKSSGSSSPTATPAASPAPAVLSMQLVGANAAAGSSGLDKLASTTNYLGATQATSLTNTPNYSQVEYQNVYAGINLIYYGNQQQLEFNFVVSAGADPQTIALRFQGADSIALDGAGNLVLQTAGGDVIENAPVAYQTINGTKQAVAGAFVVQGTNQVGFQLGTYDPSQPLVIDPVVVYSTYLGGTGADVGSAIAVDSSGNTYVTGYTNSLSFTPPFSSLQPVFTGGYRETYVTKFGPGGNIVSATYLGGASTAGTAETYNAATSIAVDTAGDVFLTGYSEYSPTSVQFQTTLIPFPSPISPGVTALGAFVAELNPQLNQFVYSTYLGTSGSSNEGAGIAVDAAGDAYVAGTYYGTFDVPFLAKLDPTGNVLWDNAINASSVSTLDPALTDSGNYATGIALDAAGNAYVVGSTDASNFGSPVLPQVNNPGGYDVFVLKVLPNGQQSYLAQVGGSDSTIGNTDGLNYGNAIAVDAAGDAYVTGTTDSDEFPTVNPYQAASKAGDGGYTAFVSKLNPAGTQLLYSTYLGGSGGAPEVGLGNQPSLYHVDSGNGIAVDGAGNAYVIGVTNSVDFPTRNAVQSAFGNGDHDAFVTELNAGGSGLIYSTFYAGSGGDANLASGLEVFDYGDAIAVDQYGSAYITGYTTSADFTTHNAAQSTFGGGVPNNPGPDSSEEYPPDAFVVKLGSSVIVTAQPVTAYLGQVFSGAVATFTAPDPVLPGSNYTALINWGDGTAVTFSTDIRQTQNPAAPYQVYGTHTYTKVGAYVINVTVGDITYGLTGTTAYNVSQLPDNQSETTIAVDPVVNPNDPNNLQVFAASNSDTTPSSLFAARSSNGGVTWTPSTNSSGVLTSTGGLVPNSGGDPKAVFDQFGNLFLTEMSSDNKSILVLMSADGGRTFTTIQQYASQGSATSISDDPEHASVDQPSVAVGPGNQPGTGSVWVTYADIADNTVFVAGAPVTGLGQVGSFQLEDDISGAGQLGNFGNIAVGPSGQVLVTWENFGNANPQDAIMVSANPDGLKNSANFSTPLALSPVLPFSFPDTITPQPFRGISPDIRLAWDRSSGPHNGRVYLTYTDAPDFTNFPNDTDIFLRYSDNNGATWSAPVRVNDDTLSSQFFASVAVDQSTGDVAVAWYDTRNDPLNQQTQYFVAVSADGGLTFSPNEPVSPGPSSTYFAELSFSSDKRNQYGDYEGLAFVNGMLYPIWTDNSAALGGNPDLPTGAAFASSYDVAVARVAVATITTPLPPLVTGLPIAAKEGQSFPGMVATFTDSQSYLTSTDFTATINWGDGTSPDSGASVTITPSGATDNHFIIRGSHAYVMAGTYIVTVTVHDKVNNIDGTTVSDVSQMPGDQSEPSIAIDPNDPSRLFVVSNEEATGLFAAVSSDGGVTWSGRTMADGSDGLPVALCDPKAAFDQFGNLFLTYLDPTTTTVIVALSTDGGQSFTTLDTFYDPTGVDQPTVTTGPGVGGKDSAVWETFLEGTQIVASGASVTGLGLIGTFSLEQVAAGPADGTTRNFGDVAVGPSGQVLIDYQTPSLGPGPSAVYVNLDANGLSPGGFGAPVLVTSTQVGGFDPIPPQQVRKIAAEANLAWDRSGGPHNGRVYLAYTDAPAPGNQATKIFLRYSDDNGMTWSAPVAVSDDKSNSSEFLPSIAVDQSDGDVVVAWYDARNDTNDVTTQFFAAVSSDGGQTFSPNVPVSAGTSDATDAGLDAFGQKNQYGDYTGVAFAGGILYPAWTDNSPELLGNPDLPNFDIAEGRPAVAHVADLPLTATPLSISADVKDEGGQFTANLATFTDPDPNAQASYYTVTIDWGDPDPNTGAADTTAGTIVANGGGQFTVSGTHVYQAASAYTITITIKDKGGSSISVTTPALIQDAPLNPGGNVALTAYVGQPFKGIVGTFTDTDPNGAPNDYSTTINWGDQQQSSGLVTFAGSAALTYDSADNTLYTFGNNDLVANNPSYLTAISLQGVVTPVSPVDGTFYGGIAFDPVNSTLYALSNAADGVSTLMSYNFSAQTFSPVAVLGSGFTGGLAFNSADGNLYAIAAAGAAWEIDKITLATGSVKVLGTLAPAGNQPPLSYTGLSFYSDGNAYAVGNDSDGNSTLYRLTIGASVTITSIGQLGNNLTTPPSTQEGFTGGLAAVPAGAPGPGSLLAGSLVGISGDGSGTSYLNTIDVDGTASSAFEVYVPAPSGQTKPASGDFSNGFDIIASHTYAQVMTTALTVLITDVEPSQVSGSVVRSTATDGGTVTVVYPPFQALPAPPAFTAYQGYPTGTLNLAGFTVPGGPDTAPGAYSAAIDWGDGSLLATGAIVISGTTITVSGQHTYATSGNFQPTVVLDDKTGGSATVTDAMSVVADLTAAPAPAPFTAFQNDATGTLTLANFSIPAALPGAGSGRYTATIAWGSGGLATPGSVQITGLTVMVSGSYTYANSGAFQPTVVLQDDIGGGSATLTDAVTVLADVTSQVHPVSSGPIYNPLTRLFNGSATITNTSATPLSGPFPLVFQGLPAGVTLANATGSTGGGIPYVSDALATLPPGQSSTVAVQFQDPQLVPITYALQIIDPSPVNPLQLVSTIAPSLISATPIYGVDPSGGVSMSADGRYVVFAANASNLTSFGATTPNGGEQVFVRDTVTGTTTLVSVNSSGTGYGGPPSLSPVISPDGRYVAFLSEAGNLVSGGTAPAGYAIFVRDLQAGTTTEVSVTSDIPVFSGNSQFLVFESTQTNLVTNDTTPGQLFEYNLQTGTTTMVSVDAAGTDGGNFVPNGNTGVIIPYNASVSADGRSIVFQSQSTNLVANDSVSGIQLFVRDMRQGTTTLITAQPGNYFPQISADGSTVVFTSGLASLVPGVSGTQLYAYHVQTQTTSLVSVDVPGFGGGSPIGSQGAYYQPAVTPDGRYVAYTFVALGGDQVYVRDLQANTTVLVSAGLNGGNGTNPNPLANGGSGLPLVSADGRYVVFVSNYTNLVANDAAGNEQLFERDLQLGTTTLVTVNDTGTNAGNGPAQAFENFSMSQDGHYVAFVSLSSDLVPNDYNEADDVFERDIPAQTTVLVSAADPELPDVTGSTVNISDNPSVSADGRYVAFASVSAQLVTNVPTGGSQIYVRDLQAQTTTLVSIDSAGTSDGSGGYPGYGSSQNPVISADGRFVLFESYATNLVANDNLTGVQLYIRDLQTGVTSLVSVPLNGTNSGFAGFYQAEISTNDRYVVFQSTATDLVANDAAGGCQVYIRDLQEGTTSLVSVDSAGTNGADNASDAFYYLPEISADGRYVAFQSYSYNLVAGETKPYPGYFDVFERDLQTGVTSLVSVNKTGGASDYEQSYLLAMTPDGRYVVFNSSAGDLTANAPHGGVFERDLQQGTTTLVSVSNAIAQSVSSDGRFITFSVGSGVYVRDMQTAATSLVSVEQDGTGISNGVSGYSSISANGRFVLFQSSATNLVSATIASGTIQLYVRDLQTGITKLVSIAPDGTQSADQSTGVLGGGAQFSADGSTVVFETGADNLANDFNSSNSIILAYSTASFTVPAGVLQVSAVPIHAVEGASFSGGVASFTDTDGDPIGNYSATINWGDGGTSPGTISANTDGGFNVTGTHTFAEAGFYPIKTTVSDSDGSTASASTTVVDTGPAGDITYPVRIDTSALAGTTGSLAFQFNPGAEPGAQPAVASISNFTVTGGSLTSVVTDQGGASGSLAGTAHMTNSAVLNEIQQGITFGGSVSFEITISGAAVEQSGNGDFGSTFAVQLLGADGVTPQATINPSGAPLTVDVNPDGSTRVTNFASSAQGGAPVAGTPNVADAPLAATGTSLQAAAGTPLTAVIATFTDANPDAQLTDYAVPTIAWGDGRTSTGAITRQSNGTFDVSGTHTYADGGTFAADVTINDLGGSAATASTTIIITSASPAPTTISVNSVTAVYDGQPHGATAEVYGPGNIDLGPATIIYPQGAIPVDAGSYSLTASFAGNSDYAADTVTVPGTITITPATPTVAAKDDITMYTGTPQAYLDSDVTVTGANGLNGSSGTLSYTYNGSAAVPTTAGSYSVIATFTPTNATDYASATGTATLTITPAPLTIKANAETKVYGNSDPTLTYQITAGSLVNGDHFSGNLIRDPGESVGTYAIRQGTLTAGSNYNLNYVGAYLTIAPQATVEEFLVLFGSRSYNVIGSSRYDLPWQITGIQVVFNEPVIGGNVSSLSGVQATAFSASGDTLTWTISPLTQGTLTPQLATSGPNAITDTGHNALAPQNVDQTIRVLYGDVNGDGVVNSADMVDASYGYSNPSSAYYDSIYADLDGNGIWDVNDTNIVRRRIGAHL